MKRNADIFETMTPEELTLFKPLSQERIEWALIVGWNERCDAEGAPWKKLPEPPEPDV